ncbi:hypothetical protein KEM55_007309, partial [Ascosphaera atra]
FMLGSVFPSPLVALLLNSTSSSNKASQPASLQRLRSMSLARRHFRKATLAPSIGKSLTTRTPMEMTNMRHMQLF